MTIDPHMGHLARHKHGQATSRVARPHKKKKILPQVYSRLCACARGTRRLPRCLVGSRPTTLVARARAARLQPGPRTGLDEWIMGWTKSLSTRARKTSPGRRRSRMGARIYGNEPHVRHQTLDRTGRPVFFSSSHPASSHVF